MAFQKLQSYPDRVPNYYEILLSIFTQQIPMDTVPNKLRVAVSQQAGLSLEKAIRKQTFPEAARETIFQGALSTLSHSESLIRSTASTIICSRILRSGSTADPFSFIDTVVDTIAKNITSNLGVGASQCLRQLLEQLGADPVGNEKFVYSVHILSFIFSVAVLLFFYPSALIRSSFNLSSPS